MSFTKSDKKYILDTVTKVVTEVVSENNVVLEKRLETKFDKKLKTLEENLKKYVRGQIALLELRLEKRFEKIENRISFLPTKKEFYNTMDKISGELETMRQEHAVIGAQYERIEKRFKKHFGVDLI